MATATPDGPSQEELQQQEEKKRLEAKRLEIQKTQAEAAELQRKLNEAQQKLFTLNPPDSSRRSRQRERSSGSRSGRSRTRSRSRRRSDSYRDSSPRRRSSSRERQRHKSKKKSTKRRSARDQQDRDGSSSSSRSPQRKKAKKAKKEARRQSFSPSDSELDEPWQCPEAACVKVCKTKADVKVHKATCNFYISHHLVKKLDESRDLTPLEIKYNEVKLPAFTDDNVTDLSPGRFLSFPADWDHYHAVLPGTFLVSSLADPSHFFSF